MQAANLNRLCPGNSKLLGHLNKKFVGHQNVNDIICICNET